MSIFIDSNTRLLVQGITGREGSFHTRQMVEYGTKVVAGVTPGKGGQRFDDAIPIFNVVADAVRQTGANTSVIYVPPAVAAGAIMEAADAGISLIVCITEGVPVMDMARTMINLVGNCLATVVMARWEGVFELSAEDTPVADALRGQPLSVPAVVTPPDES